MAVCATHHRKCGRFGSLRRAKARIVAFGPAFVVAAFRRGRFFTAPYLIRIIRDGVYRADCGLTGLAVFVSMASQ